MTKLQPVKMVSDGAGVATVAGYAVLFGDKSHRDGDGEYFVKSTELWLDRLESVPLLFHHGMDDTIGGAVLGGVKGHVVRDAGVWVESWVRKASEYFEMVKQLLEKEKLWYSPGSAPHLAKKSADGRIDRFPIVEMSLTSLPAQYRLMIEPLEFQKATEAISKAKRRRRVAQQAKHIARVATAELGQLAASAPRAETESQRQNRIYHQNRARKLLYAYRRF